MRRAMWGKHFETVTLGSSFSHNMSIHGIFRGFAYIGREEASLGRQREKTSLQSPVYILNMVLYSARYAMRMRDSVRIILVNLSLDLVDGLGKALNVAAGDACD